MYFNALVKMCVQLYRFNSLLQKQAWSWGEKPPEVDKCKKKIHLINMLSISLICFVNLTLLHPSFWTKRVKGLGNDERANDSSLTWLCWTITLQAPSQTLMWWSFDKRTLGSVTEGSLSRFNEYKWTVAQ